MVKKRLLQTCWLKEARWERRARSWDGAGGHRSNCPKGRTTPGDRRESPTTRVNPADGSEIIRVNCEIIDDDSGGGRGTTEI